DRLCHAPLPGLPGSPRDYTPRAGPAGLARTRERVSTGWTTGLPPLGRGSLGADRVISPLVGCPPGARERRTRLPRARICHMGISRMRFAWQVGLVLLCAAGVLALGAGAPLFGGEGWLTPLAG